MHWARSNLIAKAMGVLLVAALAGAGEPASQESAPNATPAAPVSQPKAKPTSIPGLSPDTFTVPPGRYFPEGTFLVRRTGTIRTLRTGEVVFIPDMPVPRDARRRGERPMILLPSQTLAALQSSIATSPNPLETRVEVSGQLFVYRERQQLLPTIFTILPSSIDASRSTSAVASPSETPPATLKDEDGEVTAVRPGDDPEVADIIKQLESRRSHALPPISAATTDPVETESTHAMTASDAELEKPSRSLVPEGTLLTDRRGRLVRIGSRLGIAFDGDANTPAEPAMYIIRSKALERLESAIGGRDGTVDVILTGRVYAYRNQNYVLPLMVQVEPPSQLRPLQ